MFKRCTSIRWSITSQLDQGEDLSRKTLEHCSECESCASFLEQSKLLQINLDRRVEVEPNDQRSQQIINAVHRQRALESERTRKPGVRPLSNQWVIRTACCAVVCLLAILVVSLNQPQVDSQQAEIANLQQDILSLTTFMQSASEPLKVLSRP